MVLPGFSGVLPGYTGGTGCDADDFQSSSMLQDDSLSGIVCNLENSMAALLAEYRRGMETTFDDHLKMVYSKEAAFQQEAANLRAENALLRERLGLEKKEAPELMQTVVMHDASLSSKKKGPNDKDDPLGDSGCASPTKNKENSKTMKTKSKTVADVDKIQAPGGSWQQFVAWVPNGAGLATPEPWKPLGDIDLMLPPQEIENDNSSEGSNKDAAFQVLEIWEASKSELNAKRQSVRPVGDKFNKDVSTRPKVVDEEEDVEGEDVFNQEQSIGFFIIHPQSAKRITWDIMSLCLVVYDMVLIPMSLFTMGENMFITIMDWTTRIFWTLDVGWSCCTAIVMKTGDVNFDARFILKRYLRTWFPLDLVIVSSDWMEVILDRIGSSGNVGNLAKSFRTARVVRLLRLVRMQEVMVQITERIQSDKLTFVLDILKSIVFVVAVSHVIGCCWWGVGTSGLGDSWVQQKGYETSALGTQYLVSLHWSLSQFTGGMDEFAPVGSIERLYAVLAWIFGFVSATIIVSILTSKLTQLYMIGGAQSRQMSTLKKYLKQNDISSNLALRMVKSAKHAMSGDLTPDAVEMLHVVSEPLKVEMHFEQYSAVIRSHPFFAEYIQEGPYVMRRVCHFANSTLMLANGDIVFSKGENPANPKMYFVWKGSLEYSIGAGDSTPVVEKQWIAEPVLWTKWTHRGMLTATNDVKLVCLDAKTFQEIVDRFKDIGGFDPKVYAADFVRYLNQLEVVNDLVTLRER
eukprot:TRINITY_DN18250_c0_g2_i1.p1 TRINITY_DN18250_c0_g2~~TRINITY_DN18250_c0_g2_i1.p1  ORF type:complete len:745 (+),score=177.87 TRINITY_DN18250_c0_g2_i1:145-2379(+)